MIAVIASKLRTVVVEQSVSGGAWRMVVQIGGFWFSSIKVAETSPRN